MFQLQLQCAASTIPATTAKVITMKSFAISVALVSLSGCSSFLAFFFQFDCRNAYVDPENEHNNATDYDVSPNRRTPDGIDVDTSGKEIDLAEVDRLTSYLEDCANIKIKRCGVTVKIAPDSHWQECAGRELFPCTTSELAQDCTELSCPCGCAGTVQYPATAVVTPNLAAYVHELIHIVFRADESHTHPAFKKCPGPT